MKIKKKNLDFNHIKQINKLTHFYAKCIVSGVKLIRIKELGYGQFSATCSLFSPLSL